MTLARHADDTGPGASGNLAELRLNLILLLLNLHLEGLVGVRFVRHGLTSAYRATNPLILTTPQIRNVHLSPYFKIQHEHFR